MFLSFVRLSTTQGFVSFPLRRVSQFVVSASFPAATQVYSAFCLRRLLVPFRLCPSPAATQGFVSSPGVCSMLCMSAVNYCL